MLIANLSVLCRSQVYLTINTDIERSPLPANLSWSLLVGQLLGQSRPSGTTSIAIGDHPTTIGAVLFLEIHRTIHCLIMSLLLFLDTPNNSSDNLFCSIISVFNSRCSTIPYYFQPFIRQAGINLVQVKDTHRINDYRHVATISVWRVACLQCSGITTSSQIGGSSSCADEEPRWNDCSWPFRSTVCLRGLYSDSSDVADQCLSCIAKFCWRIPAAHPIFLALLVQNSPQPTNL